jgi:hypothetical protein
MKKILKNFRDFLGFLEFFERLSRRFRNFYAEKQENYRNYRLKILNFYGFPMKISIKIFKKFVKWGFYWVGKKVLSFFLKFS